MVSPKSSLVSSQGASSPPLPNGCGRELNGPSLCRDQKGKVSGVRRATGANRATKEGKASGRSDRQCHLPSASGEARGPCEFQEEPVDELQENKYPYTEIAGDENGNTWTQALLARDELDGWPDLRP